MSSQVVGWRRLVIGLVSASVQTIALEIAGEEMWQLSYYPAAKQLSDKPLLFL